MDYEKKNKDAISTIKQALRQLATNGVPVGNMIEAIKNIEKKYTENEDERIRKEIIRYLQVTSPAMGENIEKMLAWLEKKGEQKSANTDFSDLRTWKYIVDAVLTEKDGIGQYIDNPFTEEVAKKLQKRFGNIEQKPAWSEEDEKFVHGLIRGLAAVKDIHGHTTFSPVCIDITKTIDWLKFLKNRVQPQNIAYYNPYKEVVKSIAEMCQRYDRMDLGSLQDFYDNVKVKCKDAKEYDSLFPQSHWKPSDEQMKILNEVLNFAANHESPHWNDYIFGTLNNLIEQLKKLMDK